MRALLLFSLLAFSRFASGQTNTYDLVIANGRVLDPETRSDAVRWIGIRDGRIAAVASSPFEGKRVIEAKGLVVAPGFIDLHAHGQDRENQQLQARDGVTSAFEMELGSADVEQWYKEREGKRIIHSGVSVGHVPSRMVAVNDPGAGKTLVPTGDGARRAATEEEITLIKRSIERGLQQGAVGVGFGIQYTPAASRWEILETFRVAGRFRAPVFVHIRHMGDVEPDALNAVEEVLAASLVTGTPLHIVHITSSGLRQTPKLLTTIREAQARGVDVTTECYPYTAAMTQLSSAMFDPGWQKVLGINYEQVEWIATGERLNERTFHEYRKMPTGFVIMHMIPDDAVKAAMADPAVIIASDGVITAGKGHPRGTGTFARVLGHYVREQKALTLMDAVRKMSYLPARRMEGFVPQMKNKGRIKVGADADLAIFDAAKVIDKATFQQPALPSVGIPYVIVAGVPVVDGGTLTGAAPGKAVRAPLRLP